MGKRGHIDILMGGRLRDNTGGSIDFGEIIAAGDYNEFISAIENLVTQIESLDYQAGDLITVEMINDYTSVFNSLESFVNEISNIEGVDPAVIQNFENLLQTFQTAINSLVEGENLTDQQYTDLTNVLNEFSRILHELETSISNNSSTELRALIENILNEYDLTQSGGAETVLLEGSITWVSGLTFHATDLKYKILGQLYTASARDITLDAADANNPRIDAFAADEYGNIFAVTGTSAADPAKPVIPYNQLEITLVNIAAGATEPSNFTVAVVYDELDAAEWTPTSQADADISVNTNDASDPATGAAHISATLDIPDATGNSPKHFIGERYQGGVIIWIDPASSGKRGLIAALEDAAAGVFWSNLSGDGPYGTGADGTTIGTGQANTLLMLANGAAYDDAARYADQFQADGYTDFFIPAIDTLLLMYKQRYNIPGMLGKTYWSSTEAAWDKARRVEFNNGGVASRKKNNRYNVRPVRFFDDSAQNFDVPVTEYSPENTVITLTAPAAVATAGGILTAQIKTSKPWLATTALLLESYLEGTKTGAVTITPANFFGFNPAKSGEYQTVSIPLSALGVAASIDKLTIRLINTWRNGTVLSLDNIRIQYDEAQAPAEVGGGLWEQVEGNEAYIKPKDNKRIVVGDFTPAESNTASALLENGIYFRNVNDDIPINTAGGFLYPTKGNGYTMHLFYRSSYVIKNLTRSVKAVGTSIEEGQSNIAVNTVSYGLVNLNNMDVAAEVFTLSLTNLLHAGKTFIIIPQCGTTARKLIIKWGTTNSATKLADTKNGDGSIDLSTLGANYSEIIECYFDPYSNGVYTTKRILSNAGTPVPAKETLALSDSIITVSAADDFERTCDADEQFTITNPVLKKVFRLKLTGGSLNATLFNGYNEHWIRGSVKADYLPASDNWLYCEIRATGEIYLYFET